MRFIYLVLLFLFTTFYASELSAQTIFSENFETGIGGMANDGGNSTNWISSNTFFRTGAQSLRNSGQGNNETNIIFQSNNMDLTAYADATFTFWHIAKTEGVFDQCFVEISDNGGASWTALPNAIYSGSATDYTTRGYFHEDSYATWGTTNSTPDNASWWREETFDLSAYIGQNDIRIRFRLTTDGSVTRSGGWIIDDLLVSGTLSCTTPSATYTLVPDCGNAQFNIDVNITALGDATGVDISDGTTTYQTNVGTGIYTVGPFAAGSNQTITVDGSSYSGCPTNSSVLTEACDCATPPSATVNSTNLNCGASTYDIEVTVTNDGSGDLNLTDILIDGASVQANAITGNLYTFTVAVGTHTVTLEAEGSGFVTCTSIDYNETLSCDNDECSGAFGVATNGTPTTSLDVTTYSSSGNNLSCDGGASNEDAYYSFVAPPSGQIYIEVDNSNLTGSFVNEVEGAIYNSCVDAASNTEVSCFSFSNSLADGQIVSGLTPGNTYLLEIEHYNNDWTGTYDVIIVDMIPELSLGVQTCGDFAVAPDRNNVDAVCGGPAWVENGDYDKVFMFTPTSNTTVNVALTDLANSVQTIEEMGLMLTDGLTTGSTCLASSFHTTNSTADLNLSSVPLVSGTTYYIIVITDYGFDSSPEETFCIQIDADCGFTETNSTLSVDCVNGSYTGRLNFSSLSGALTYSLEDDAGNTFSNISTGIDYDFAYSDAIPHTVTLNGFDGASNLVCSSVVIEFSSGCNGTDICTGAPDISNTCAPGSLTSALAEITNHSIICGSNTIRTCNTYTGFSTAPQTNWEDIWYSIDNPDGANDIEIQITGLSASFSAVTVVLYDASCGSADIIPNTNGGTCVLYDNATTSFTYTNLAAYSDILVRVLPVEITSTNAGACAEISNQPAFNVCANVPLPNDLSSGILQYTGPTTPYNVINADFNIQDNPVCQDMNAATVSATSLPADCSGTPFDLGGNDLWYYVEIPDGQIDTRLKLSVTFDNAGETVYAIVSNGPTALQECTVLSSSSNGETVTYTFDKNISEGTSYDPTHYFIRLIQPATNGISTFCVNAELVAPNDECDFFNQVTIDYRLFDGTNPLVNPIDFAFASSSGVALPSGSTTTDPDLWYIVDPTLTTDGNGLQTWSGYLDMITAGLGVGESVELVLYRRNGYSGNCVDYAGDFVSSATITADGTERIECLDMLHASAAVGDGYILRAIQTTGTDITLDLSAQPDQIAPPTNDLCSLLYDGTNLSFEAQYYDITNGTINASFQESRNCEGISDDCSGISNSHNRDLWFYFEIPSNSCPDYTVSTTIDEATITYNAGDAFRDAKVYVYADCDASTIMGCATLDGAGEAFTVDGLSPGETYLVRVMPSALNSNQTYSFDISSQLGPVRPCHDDPTNAGTVNSISTGFDRASCPTVTMSAQGATETSNVADGWHDVWYTITAPNNGGPYVLQEGYLSLYLESVTGQTMKIELYEVAGADVANNRLGSATTDAFDEARLHVGHLVPGKTYYIRVAHNEPNLAGNNELVEFRLCAYETAAISSCPFLGTNIESFGVECNTSCSEFYKIDIPEGTPSAFYRIEVIGDNGQQLDFRVRYQGMDAPSNEGNLTDIDHPCNAGANLPVEGSGPLSDPGTCNGGSGFWKTYNMIGPAVGQRNYYYIEVYHPVDVVGCGGLDICEVRFFGPYTNITDANVGGTTNTQGCNSLPIELTAFEATAEDQHNLIRWRWEEAIDFDRFELERSADGIGFEPIHEVAFNTINGQSYEYQDQNFNKTDYYRLKMIDLDGSIEYSEILVVERQIRREFQLYPNPLQTGKLRVYNSYGAADLEIYDFSGKLIRSYAIPDKKAIELTVDLAPGVYSVVLINSYYQISKRLIVID
jgi:hypothetical protein